MSRSFAKAGSHVRERSHCFPNARHAAAAGGDRIALADLRGARLSGCRQLSLRRQAAFSAIHFQHANPQFPKLFISELKSWELPAGGPQIIARRCVRSHRRPLQLEVFGRADIIWTATKAAATNCSARSSPNSMTCRGFSAQGRRHRDEQRQPIRRLGARAWVQRQPLHVADQFPRRARTRRSGEDHRRSAKRPACR